MTDSRDDTGWMFQLFNEIGIIDQLVSAAFSKVLAEHGLNQSEFSVLNHFVRMGDGKTPSYLAKAFQMTKPSMTAIIAKLEAHRLVEVSPAPDDGRKKIVTITDAGRRARTDGIKAMAPLGTRWAAGMDVAALKQALPVLKNLREYLDEDRNADDGLN